MLKSKLLQQLICLVLIAAGALIGNMERPEIRDQYILVTLGLWLECTACIWYTRLVSWLRKYGTPIRVVIVTAFVALQISTIPRFSEFDASLASLSTMVGSLGAITLLTMALWKSVPTNQKTDKIILNEHGKLPIFLQVTIPGASSVEDDKARQKTVERVVKPFVEKFYETTDLSGQDGGEMWVLLFRKF